MAVNIFGEGIHISGTGGPRQRGQPGIGFKILDDEGNYDIDGKRMANVGFPEGDNNTVSKAYVDKDSNTIRTSLASCLGRVSGNEDTLERLSGEAKSRTVAFDDSLLSHRVYIDRLVIEIRKGLTDVNTRVDLMAEETFAVTTKLGNVDNRLLGLSNQVFIQSDILTGISAMFLSMLVK